MSNDWFFEKFALISDAPGAVARMRELVLDLAVRGKLMPQDPNEEPAKETLKRVDAEREQLVKAKGIRRHDTLGPVPVEAIPFAIPVNWQWCYLADVCFLITDGAHHTPQYLESGVPFLSVKDVSRGSIDFSSTRYISEEAHRELCKRCQPELGDVLLTKVGTTGIAVNVEDDRDFSIFVSLALLKFSQPNLDGRFLTYLINSPFVRQQSAKNTQGIGNKNLVLRLINRFIVPLPPLAEQKRIVAKVEELMGICDALEAQQQELESRKSVLVRSSLSRFAESPTPENLGYLFHKSYDIPPSELRKSILTLAVQGKLVPQDSNDEPASSILEATQTFFKRLVAEKKLSEPKPLPRIDDHEEPFSLPPGWEWCRLGHVIRISSGDGLIAKDMVDGLVPVYGGNGVNGYHNRNNVAKRTLVIGRVGFYCGSIHITPAKAWVTDNAFITTFNDQHLDLDFLSWLLKATDLRKRDNATAQPVISGAKIYPTILALPPLVEQRRIVAKVDQLMALVDELERQQEASREKASKLLDAIVQEMTSGG
jgi:type I restriction enzyme S subunit